MKIQNFAVIFIVIVLPIALILSVYTGNLIDVANKQASYDAMLLNSTYDAVRAYQMNTLTNSFESETNAKVRDINASINSFFNSLASGMSSSGFGKEELTDYIPAILYTLYDGYYVYGTYDNVVISDENGIQYNEESNVKKQQYGIKPYIYYSCEYQGRNNGKEYDLIVNYTLDNYITVTGTYQDDIGETINIALSGYYIDYNNVSFQYGGNGPAPFENKNVILYPGTDKQVTIAPEKLGEYLTTLDLNRVLNTNPQKNEYSLVDSGSGKKGEPKYYNYIIYNNVKYYLDTDLIYADENGKLTAVPKREIDDNEESNKPLNITYDGIPIFFLERDTRTYISRSTFDELKSFLGISNDEAMYRVDPVGDDNEGRQCYRDVNAYYYYYKSTTFSQKVYDALKLIDLGTTTITEENGTTSKVITSNLPFDADGGLPEGNVIKTDTYHTNYVSENGVISHGKTTYDTSAVFDFEKEGNDPELESSSFNHHRIDVIVSSIESSLVSSIDNFKNYSGGNYDYAMPVLSEEDWNRICNNMTVVSFMQGISIGNYKYYSSYAIVANTKVRDFISKESIYVQEAEPEEGSNNTYHNPRCELYNLDVRDNERPIVGYRNIDYDRQTCTMLHIESNGTDEGEEYYYFMQPGTSAYECVVGRNDNIFSTDDLFNGNDFISDEVRRAYITALAREKGNSYKTYGFLNQDLQIQNTMSPGEALYTVYYMYQNYGENTYFINGNPYKAVALIGTDITDLEFNRTPQTGYYYLGDENIRVLNFDTDNLEPLNENNRKLQYNASNNIYLFFNVDMNQKKQLYYDVEFYVWNHSLARYVLDNVVRYDGEEQQKWINSDNNVDVSIPQQYKGSTLVYTDETGYEVEGKQISTGSVIKAYYSDTPQYSNNKYIVRYHSNGGTGTMDNNTFKFYEGSTLAQNQFVKEGYAFKGWSIGENQELKYTDMETIVCSDDEGMTVENDTYYLDLYAIWTEITYQIAYLPNGATSGYMPNSVHQFDVPSRLSKNQYIKEYNLSLDLGLGESNFYSENFEAWGDSAMLTFYEDSKTYDLTIVQDASNYNGMYYAGTNAILRSGKVATISFDVYSEEDVTLVFKIQNSVVGEDYSEDRADGNPTGEPLFIDVQGGNWTRVYFTYRNGTTESIYDYSILSVEDTSSTVNLKIKNPRFEITNAVTERNDKTETFVWKNNFLHWTYNDTEYQDEQEILNLTTQPDSVVNMTAQWDNDPIYLPELFATGYVFQGWIDQYGNKHDKDEPFYPDNDYQLEAVWEDTVPPIVDIEVVDTTTNSITTVTTVEDEGSGMIDSPTYMYYIKEHGQPDDAYKEINGGDFSEYTFTGLKHNTEYDIKVVVIADNAGNRGTDSTMGTTRELSGRIFVKSQTWYQNSRREGTQAIEFGANNVSSEFAYIEYRKENDENWTKMDIAYGVEHGETVYARITDGTNHLDSISAKAWDDIKPVIDYKNITSIEDANTNLLVYLTVTELESGIGEFPNFKFYYKKATENDYHLAGESSEFRFNYSNLEQQTLYNFKITVSDRAGNVGELYFDVKTTYKYLVHYDGNGATSGEMEDELQIEDQWFQVAVNKYERIGYHYLGYWKHGVTGVNYYDKQWAVNLSPDPTTVTLYAQWIDDIPPTMVSLTKNTDRIVSGDVGVILTGKAYDLGTGIVAHQFSMDANLTKDSGGWIEREASNETLTFTYTARKNGTYYLYVKDGAGNINKISITIENIMPDPVTYPANSNSNPYWTWECSTTGYYNFYVAGAGGGNSYTVTYTGSGSSGGYVSMNVYAERGAKLYLCVGAVGVANPTVWEPGVGGYNGGGDGGRGVTITRNADPNRNNLEMASGAGGSGLTSVANYLIGDGQLIRYSNPTIASQYMLAVAGGGGGGMMESFCLPRFGRATNRVHGGSPGSGSSGIFGKGQGGANFRWLVWRQSGGITYQDSTEGPFGGGGGWYGGWSNLSSYGYQGGNGSCPGYTKCSGEGGSNYATTANKVFQAGNEKIVKVLSSSNGIGSNGGRDGYVTITWDHE